MRAERAAFHRIPMFGRVGKDRRAVGCRGFTFLLGKIWCEGTGWRRRTSQSTAITPSSAMRR